MNGTPQLFPMSNSCGWMPLMAGSKIPFSMVLHRTTSTSKRKAIKSLRVQGWLHFDPADIDTRLGRPRSTGHLTIHLLDFARIPQHIPSQVRCLFEFRTMAHSAGSVMERRGVYRPC